MTAFLFYGDTERSPAMRHELPVTIGDPFLLGVVDGRLHVMASGLERARIEAAAPDAVLHDYDKLGFRELLESGMSRHELELELASRAAAAMGIRAATADPFLPPAVRDLFAHVDEDGFRIAALLVARLRFERLMNGSREAAAWFEGDPEGFAETFRAYHAHVAPTAFFPAAEGRLFAAYLEERYSASQSETRNASSK